MTDDISRLFIVAGKVQGVFFRASAAREAVRLGIRGHALNLPDGLHCNSDPPTRDVQMRDFLTFARDAAERRRIFCLTHSSITTSGYESTTQTANYLLAGLGTGRTPWTATDSIGQMYSRADTGRFHLGGYLGETAPDHLKHLFNPPESDAGRRNKCARDRSIPASMIPQPRSCTGLSTSSSKSQPASAANTASRLKITAASAGGA